MHFPRMSRELFMFPASFSLSPNVLVLLHLSEPARSHRENLRNTKQFINRYFLYYSSFRGAGAIRGVIWATKSGTNYYKLGPMTPEQ